MTSTALPARMEGAGRTLYSRRGRTHLRVEETGWPETVIEQIEEEREVSLSGVCFFLPQAHTGRARFPATRRIVPKPSALQLSHLRRSWEGVAPTAPADWLSSLPGRGEVILVATARGATPSADVAPLGHHDR